MKISAKYTGLGNKHDVSPAFGLLWAGPAKLTKNRLGSKLEITIGFLVFQWEIAFERALTPSPNTTLFYGDSMEYLSGLYLNSVLKRGKKIVSGHVINGEWDLLISKGRLLAGSQWADRFTTVTDSPCPKIMIEVPIPASGIKSYQDYNEVLSKCELLIPHRVK